MNIAEDSTITIGLVLAVMAITSGLWLYFERKFAQTAKDRKAIDDRLTAFELKVTEQYVSDERLLQLETRLTTAIDRLVKRFDDFATDFHRAIMKGDR